MLSRALNLFGSSGKNEVSFAGIAAASAAPDSGMFKCASSTSSIAPRSRRGPYGLRGSIHRKASGAPSDERMKEEGVGAPRRSPLPAPPSC
eukprot:scaffold2165_cov294-Pinguiococcus_pyrenoidosus.AAC.6